MNALKIGHRLVFGFAGALLLLVGIGMISGMKLRQVDSTLTTINDVNSVKQRYAINFRGSVHDRAIALRDVVLLEDGADLARTLRQIDELAAKYEDSAAPLDAVMAKGAGASDEEQAILDGIKAVETAALPVIEQVIARRQAGDVAGAESLLMTKARPMFVEWLARINQFIDLQEAKNKALTTAARNVTANFQVTLMLLSAAAVAIGAGLAAWSMASIRPLSKLTALMRRMAEGDLGEQVPYAARSDEIGQMAQAVHVFRENGLAALERAEEAEQARREREAQRAAAAQAAQQLSQEQEHVVRGLAVALQRLAERDLTYRIGDELPAEYAALRDDFNTAMESLQEAMSTIVGNASAIRASANEMSTAAIDLSHRTEQQALSLEQTAAALDEITATVQRSAQGARQANEAVSAARTDAQASGEIVAEAVGAMGEIERSSKQIGQIIGVIDEIAFQTNLLALNAGVEAARAGEAGRGFAVVASEVRALAQRSAEAAKEIKNLITASSTQVNSGVALVGRAGDALERIVSQVSQVAELVSEISASAQEQALGLAQVNTAVNQMDQMTQQNAAMVEQSTAASHGLAQEAVELDRLVGGFRVGVQARRANPPVSAGRARQESNVVRLAASSAALKPSVRPSPSEWEEF
jgi:methyl-accepting chemotaxis protein